MHTALNTIAGLLGVNEVWDVAGHDVRCFAVAWASLRSQPTAAFRAQFQERYSPAPANKLLAALRSLLKEARWLGQISADDYNAAVDLRSIRVERHPRGRQLIDRENVALMRMCTDDPKPASARDVALMVLLRGTGMRRAEAVAWISPTTPPLRARSASAPAKDTKTESCMQLWEVDRRWMTGSLPVWWPGPLFYSLVKGGGLVVRRLATQVLSTSRTFREPPQPSEHRMPRRRMS